MNDAPYMTVTQDKTVVVRTSQARLYIDAKLLGSGLLGGLAQVHLPVLVELASGEARLKEIDCGRKTAALEVKPSIGSLKVGDIDLAALDDFKRPLTVSRAKLVKAPLFAVTGKSEVAIGGAAWKTVSFTDAEVKAGAVKTVKTTDTLAAATASLLAELDLDVDFLKRDPSGPGRRRDPEPARAPAGRRRDAPGRGDHLPDRPSGAGRRRGGRAGQRPEMRRRRPGRLMIFLSFKRVPWSEEMSALDWPGLESLEFDAPSAPSATGGTRRPNWPRTRCCTRRRRRWTSAPGCTRCAPSTPTPAPRPSAWRC